MIITLIAFALIIGFAQVLDMGTPALADARTDGTVGTVKTFSGNGDNFRIDAAVGKTVGGKNLFHSFEYFNVNRGEAATFTGPSSIENVMSRVTGGQRSLIDGGLAVKGMPKADFWFINPAGITFGPEAFLDVPGSFHVSTADELRFKDGAVFSARGPSASTLTVAAPDAFGFLRQNPAAIQVADGSLLLIRPGKAISLTGGDITFGGLLPGYTYSGINPTVLAPAGQVYLVSVASPGEVRVADQGITSAALGKINLFSPYIDVSGDGGGIIRIRAGGFILDGHGFFGLFSLNTGARDNAGIIDIRSDAVALSGASIGTTAIGGEGGGTATPIVIAAKSLIISGSDISSPSVTEHPGGSISLTADKLEINNSQIITDAARNGDAGQIIISANEILTIRGESTISSSAETGSGKGGTVTITAGKMQMAPGASVFTSTASKGAAGDVLVEANQLSISGTAELPSVIDSSAFAGTGHAGKVNVIVRDGQLALQGTAVISSTTSTDAAGGSIEITAPMVVLRNGGTIETVSLGRGNAGDISIKAGREIMLSGDSRVTTEATREGTTASGGSITLEAPHMIYLVDSQIASSVRGGPETAGGNIRIDPQFLILDNSNILARAFQGRGGNIDINADFILRSAESRLDASSELGINGTITATNPEIDLSKGLRELPVNFLDAAAQIPLSCEARRASGENSFGVIGRGAPPSPDAPSPGFYILDRDARAGPSTSDSGRFSEVEIATFGGPMIRGDCSTTR